MPPRTELPSLLLFGPQTEHPSDQVLEQLRQTLLTDSGVSALKDAAVGLPLFSKSLTEFDPTLSQVLGGKFLNSLSRWIDVGEPLPQGRHDDPNHYLLPLTVLLQCTQYARYLSQLESGSHKRVVESVQTGGIQGFCTGFLTAIAVASSQGEADFGRAAAAALRFAVCIGAYVDLDGAFSSNPTQYSCVAVRWRDGVNKDEEELHAVLDSYAEAYISSINDSTCVSVTLKTSELESFNRRIQEKGLRAKPVHVRGRFHNNCNAIAADKIAKLAEKSDELGQISSGVLLAPVRSTVDGSIILASSLGEITEHILANTLLKTADWFETIKSSVLQLPESNRTVAFAGQGQHIPSSLIQTCGLQVLNLDGVKGSASKIPNGIPLTDASSQYPPHSIAIVGMSGRFPGADSVDELWELLTEGKVMVEPAPVDKFKLPQTGDYANTKWWGNFLKDREAFDHKFFKKSSREAAAWDPQQRILLEVIYESLESAGYFGASSTTEPDDYGCYIGAVMNNYYDNMSCHPATAFATLGTSRCFLSGCMSHYFGWTGPSLTIDTACSSSLVAINTACRAIWSGECSRAVAGGTNVICSPFDYQNLSAAGFLSPSGQCKPFDAAADGYCRGEAVGVVVLKKLSDAIKENDNVLGVIVGSAANQNHNFSHVTVPHSGSQVSLYQKVMKLGNVEPESVSYVEAHGTGTGVGDPVEVRSIRDAFAGPHRDSILHFGSIKGSIGHTESTAGVAGLIKVLLQMRHGKIPAQTSHNTINPKIPAFDQHQMAIPKKMLPWNPAVRIACVNSYGAAGSNSAVMIREGPSVARRQTAVATSKYPLFISAASANSLSMYSQKLLNWLKEPENNSADVASVAFNLADRGNHALPHTFVATVSSMNDFKSKLELAASGVDIGKTQGSKPVVLVFGGQESTSVGLSRDVYESSAIFRYHLDSCNEIITSKGLESIYPSVFQPEPIENPVTLHSALFAVQYASAKSWMDCGLKVEAVVGHSFGQLTAFCISGALSLEDALTLVIGRATIMAKHWGTEPGSMMFIQMDLQFVQQSLRELKSQGSEHYAEIACYNGPRSHVVVGSSKSIDDLELIIGDAARTKRLQVTNGFHSKFTEPLLLHLGDIAQSLSWKTPEIALETCDELKPVSEPDSSIVAHHTRQPVFFQNAIERLEARFPQATWVEAGRGSSVLGLVKGCVSDSKSHTFFAPQLTSADAHGSLVDTTVGLWKMGHAVQFWSFHRSQKTEYEHLHLPPYQFEKTRHWLGFTSRGAEKEPEKAEVAKPETHELFTHLGYKDKSERQAMFRIDPQADRFKAMLGGHVMAGQALAPASLYFEIVARAALLLQKDTEAKTYVPTVKDLVMKSPIGHDITKEIILTLKRIEDIDPCWSFSITTQSTEGRKAAPFEVSTGEVQLKKRKDAKAAKEFKRYETLTGSRRYDELMNHPDAEKMRGNHIYRAFNTVVYYGEPFHGIKEVACVRHEAAGKVRITPDVKDPVDQRLCDTPMTDSFMQFAGFLLNYFNNPSMEDVHVCGKIEHIELGGDFDPDAKEWIVYSTMSDTDSHGNTTSDAYIFEAGSKKMVMAAFGFCFSKMSQSILERMLKTVNKAAPSNGAPTPKKSAPLTVRTTPSAPPATVKKTKKSVPKASKRKELFQVFSNVTDVPVDELKDETTLDGLGIDSLMATEVLNDIRTELGLTIDLTSFLFFPDLKAIAAHVDEQLGLGGGAEEEEEEEVEEDEPTYEHVPVPIKASKKMRVSKKPKSSKRQELFQVFSDVTDVPVEDLSDNTTLDDLGIDSLMATEVLNDIRTVLGLTIDLTSFLFFSNLKEIAAHVDQQLGFGGDEEEEEYPVSPSTDSGIADVSPPQELATIAPEPPRVTERPTITSALDSFDAIRHGYDEVAKPIQTLGFWDDAYPHQRRLVLAYVVEAFAQIGCDVKTLQPGDRVPQVKALDRHKQLVQQFYRVLEDGDLISSSNGSFTRTATPVDPESAESIYHQIIDLHPQHANVNKLVRSVGSRMAECLTGKVDGLQIVFGNKETKKTLEDMYEFWPLLRTPSLLLGDFLVKAMTNATGGGKFRILEIGAGTGGTTRYIVNRLRNYGIPFEYVFTDISASLVRAAKNYFKGVEGMSFEVLNIEEPPKPEYLASFHSIIATNCIHATRNLNVSLRNIRQMLRDDGALTLVEITQNMFWLDIVVGLFEGWWLFEDGRTHALIDEKRWEGLMKNAGFDEVRWSEGQSPESKTVRVIGAFPSKAISTSKKAVAAAIQTVVYKKVDDQDIHADIYYPTERDLGDKKMPIALMIHGGSHIIFSRKDIRPAQTRLLLEKGFLPVSLDHRMCPEASLSEGPMVDICDALNWARNTLPNMALKRADLRPDGERVVVVGWSSGGQLAMSLAYTAPPRGLRPPEAVLAFYCPTDYEDEWWRHPIQPIGAEDKGYKYDVLEAIQDKPITNYGVIGAWEPLSDPRILADPRCRIVLHINWKAQTLPIIIGGLVSKRKAAESSSVKDWNNLPQPSTEQIRAVSSRHQIRQGNYHVPTFLIHGTADDLIPWRQSQGTYQALLDSGVQAGLALVQDAPHICDLSSNPESEGWKAALRGYEFISSYVL